MSVVRSNRVCTGRVLVGYVLLLAVLLALPLSMWAGAIKKKKTTAVKTKANLLENIDVSKIVWPSPPSIARVKYTTFFAGEKWDELEATPKAKKKSGWMERVAGTQTDSEKQELHPHFSLVSPYGMGVDTKGKLYVADEKVGAIFIFDTETREVEMIKNGKDAHFGRIIGLTVDDGDRLYVSDAQLRRVLVFNSKHESVDTIDKGLLSPSGLAVDNDSRLLYVADIGLDQVLVFDADSLKLIRKIGTTGHNHELTSKGDFAKPGGVAVDSEGNLYVADTLNNRIQIFDTEGTFLNTFGKAGDGPGYFARPKGVAVDSDGNIWVADGMQDRVQVFNKKGQLLTYLGGHGNLPGQFAALCGITIDKNNRVFTSEQYPGRVQQLKYVTEAEAAAERERRSADSKKKPVAKVEKGKDNSTEAQQSQAQNSATK